MAASSGLRVLLLDTIIKWGGGQKWCVDAGAALRRRGHRVVVACGRGSPLELRAREAGVETWPARFLPLGWLLSVPRLAGFLRREKFEVVVGNVGRDLWIGALVCGISGARLLQRRGIARPVKSGPLSRWLYTRAVEKIIVNSLAIRDSMRSGVDFLDDSRFVHIPNGVDLTALRLGGRDDLRADLGVGAEAPLAGCVGRLAAMKGHEFLLRAWPRVRVRLPSAKLIIVGEGEQREALEKLSLELGLGDSVRFLGFRSDVTAVLDAVDLLVLPSVRDEGCNNSLLEAMACGRPAVVTRCGGLPEMVTEGETGLVVPPRDQDSLAEAVARLLERPDERARMGGAARRVAEERYSLEAATDLLEHLLGSFREKA
jgi:glycosyltransferase involved in cell wall biosynthesis